MNAFFSQVPGGKGAHRKSKPKRGPAARFAALLLCLTMLGGFLPALAQAADAGPLLSSIVHFGSITLHDAGSNAQIENGALIEKGRQLMLRYTYTITGDQCNQIQPNISYYLDVSPHLVLPHLEQGSSLTVKQGNGTEEGFGTIYANGSNAWVTFLPGESDGGKTLLAEKYGELQDAEFHLNCQRATDVPQGEAPVEGHSNLYAMKFENGEQITFGYAENEPVTARAQIRKDGKLQDRIITWTIDYTPWQNPAEGGEITLETPFELRDIIDASLHSYVPGSAKIDGAEVTAYTSRDDIPSNAGIYLLVETPADGGHTTLIFGGTKFNAGQATGKNPAAPLQITYETSIKDELLLPGSGSGKKVANAAGLFAGPTFDNQLGISGKADVTVEQPEWIKKEGKTTRDPGNGSTTNWTVTFQPNGFTFGAGENLTLHDQLPEGSRLVENSVEVNGAPKAVTVVDEQNFTVGPITEGSQPVTIRYQTHVSEEMYDSGTDLGKNAAWFTFHYGEKDYTTPEMETSVGSGDETGTSGTATLVKTNKGYNAAERTIGWEVTINPHQADLKQGTFTDNLKIGAPCGTNGHPYGLEVVNGKDGIAVSVGGAADGQGLVTLEYEDQCITVHVGAVSRKAVKLTYTTKVCDPCVFANNTKTAFTNKISTDNMVIGTSTTERSASAESKADVSPTVLDKKPPVYDYATGRMKWTVEVDAAGLSMEDVVLTDTLPQGLAYAEDSLVTQPEITGASASVQGQTLTIDLGTVSSLTTVTFETAVDPEILGFASDKPVVVENTIGMNGEADGVAFAQVSSKVTRSFTNHGLVKSSTVNNQQEYIDYEVLINPYRLALPENPLLVDTLDERLQLDTETLKFYKVNLNGTTESVGQKPSYSKIEESVQPLGIAAFDPDANSFTVALPIAAASRETYLLTYRADIIQRETGGYGNSVRFEGGSVLLGGNKNNTAAVGGGGGGGGGGVAARKATIAIVKTDSETKAPIPGVSFTLYQWDSGSNTRGMAFAQGTTDAQGKLSFRVKPGACYQLAETQSAPGYGSAFGWNSLPSGAEEQEGSLLITAGAQGSALELNLTNEAHTTDIVFRLFNESGVPMAGTKVQLFKQDPAGAQDPTPDEEVTVSADGKVAFSSIRRGGAYYVRYPNNQIMTIAVPADGGEQPTAILPDGTSAPLTEDYQAKGNTPEDQQWTLTVNKVVKGGTTPLAGAVIGLYADESCQTLIKKETSGADGTVTFAGLIKGQTYWVQEITAPSGYQRNTAVYEGTQDAPDVIIENAANPPVNPGGSGGPGTPGGGTGTPTDPSTPTDPDKLTDPSTPTDPNRPIDPVDPADPSKPNDPVDPADPSKPTDPNDPNGSGTPGGPNNPDKPGVPGGTEGPGEPGTPGGTDGSNKPGTSGGSGGGSAGNAANSNIPQTGDNTWLLVAATLLSGILLAAMTACQFLRAKKREKK